MYIQNLNVDIGELMHINYYINYLNNKYKYI
jgi:hypothetical protein